VIEIFKVKQRKICGPLDDLKRPDYIYPSSNKGVLMFGLEVSPAALAWFASIAVGVLVLTGLLLLILPRV
jgi:hypothetical protein